MLKVSHLGIDIGGAHLKVIGVDKKNRVVLVDYESCAIWKGVEKLKEKFPEEWEEYTTSTKRWLW